MKRILAVLILACISTLFFVTLGASQTTTNEPVLNPSNGHYYEAVSSIVIWSEANATAYNGVIGHLVTITSQPENDFILTNLSDPVTLNSYWLGGFQLANSTEPDGGWQWVTGEPFVWYNGTPNNNYGGDQGIHPLRWPEDALNFWDNIGLWNDFPSDIPGAGFIVEYDTTIQNKPEAVPSPVIIVTVSAGAASVTGIIAFFFNNPNLINRIPLPDPIKKMLQKTISKILDSEQLKKLNPPRAELSSQQKN